MKPNNIYMFSL